MRSFIAIDLPKEIKDYIALLQQKLKKSDADVKWIAPVNVHLTLKFLGEIEDKEKNQITSILSEISLNHSPFSLNLGSIGTFPNVRHPRVIWVGLNKGDFELKEIVRGLEERIEKIGIPKEDKPFASHITIGRIRTNLNRNKLIQSLTAIEKNSEKENPRFLVTKITLFKSTLTPKGPVYEAVNETTLKTV